MGNGDAVQGAAVVARAEFVVGLRGLAAGNVGGDRHEGVQRRVEPVDLRQAGLSEFDGRGLARTDGGGGFGDGH